MEFKTLRNIENSFKQIRLYAMIFVLFCSSVVGFALWQSYRFAEKQRQKIYVLDQGKSSYVVKTYAKQFIIRSSNLTKRQLITSCYLLNAVRSDNNPQGFTIEKFKVLENQDIEIIER